MEMAEPTGRRARRRQRDRSRLLEEGLALGGRRGVRATKVEEITRAAGVAKGTFFTHFASKEEFAGRLVEGVLDDLARRVRPLGLAPGEPDSVLAGVGAVHLRFFQLRPEAAAVVVEACGLEGEGPYSAAAAARLSEHLDLVAEKVAPAAAGLGWPADRVRELALMILATSVGFFWLARGLGQAGDAPAFLVDRLGRALARGLATQANPNP
jgi:AcrR family transcriptional regulator